MFLIRLVGAITVLVLGLLYLLLNNEGRLPTTACGQQKQLRTQQQTTQQQEPNTPSVVGRHQGHASKATALGLRDLSIVFIGDSMTRYQYLSLVYFLRFGHWYDNDTTTTSQPYNLMNERSFVNPFHNETWSEFLYQSNRLLSPYEQCDCYRKTRPANKPPPDPKRNPQAYRQYVRRICENRYYFDAKRNVTVAYFLAYGHIGTIHGRNRPWRRKKVEEEEEQPHEQHDSSDSSWNKLNPSKDYVYEYDDWSQFIRNELSDASTGLQPDYIVLNAGLHENYFQYDLTLKTNLVQALSGVKSLKKPAFWKTTTYQRDHTQFWSANTTDHIMCDSDNNSTFLQHHQQPQHLQCYNLSWTRNLPSNLYVDDWHMYEPAYRLMNEQLLIDEMGLAIGDIGNDDIDINNIGGYQRLDPAKILYIS